MNPGDVVELPTPPPEPRNLALEVQLLTFRVTQLENKIGRMTKLAWTLLGAIAARFGWDVSGLGPP